MGIKMEETKYIPYGEETKEGEIVNSNIKVREGKVIEISKEYVVKVPNPIKGNPSISYLGHEIKISESELYYTEWHYAEQYRLTIEIKGDLAKYLGSDEKEIKDYNDLKRKLGEIVKRIYDDLEITLNNIKIGEVKEANREHEELRLISNRLIVVIDDKTMHASVDNIIEINVNIRTSQFTNCVSRYCSVLGDYLRELNEEEEEEKIDYSKYSVMDMLRDAKSVILNFLDYLVFLFFEE